MTTKKTDKSTDNTADSEPVFEKALERLEKIVSDMEDGSLSLEQMIQRFEEGQALLKFCSTRLNEVERKIEILVKKGDGVVAEPFAMDNEREKGGVAKDDDAPF